MSSLKFLANENFPYTSFKILKAKGWNITHITNLNRGISDEEVMEIAIKERRIIITFDSDYGELVYNKGFEPSGVIYLRCREFLPNYPAILLEEIIIKDKLVIINFFTVIDANQIRQRKLK